MSCEIYVTSSALSIHQPGHISCAHGGFISARTGVLLVVLGSLLINLYPFRKHVNPHAGEMLVKIGRKLTGK